MLPYVILLGVPFIIGIVSKKHYINGRTNNAVVSTFFLLFIIILSLRGRLCGNDTSWYISFFDMAKHMSWADVLVIDNVLSTSTEPGYLVFQKLLSYILPNAQCFLAVVAFASVAPLWWFYKEKSVLPFLTVALFVTVAPFTMYFSGIRQILAMAAAVPAFLLARNKKMIWFLAVVALAFLFHRSAFILLLMYPACRFKVTVKWLWVAIPIICAVYIFNEPIFSFLLTFISDYFKSEITETGAYTMLLLLVLFAVYAYIIPDEAKLDDETLCLRNLLLVSVCIQCFAPLNPLSMRMNYYFLIFLPVLISRVATTPKSEYKKVATVSVSVMTVFFVIYFYFNMSQERGLNIYPYIPFWSETA